MKNLKNTLKLSLAVVALLLAGCSNNSLSNSDSLIDGSETSSVDGNSNTSVDNHDDPDNDKEFNGYYSSISSSDTGSTLKDKLVALNKSKRKSTVGYDGLKTAYRYIDVDWTGKVGDGKIIGFYNNALLGPNWDKGSTWNREHVWPDSRGGGTVDGDAFMTRPTSTKINSSRGNKVFAESGAYDPACEGYTNYRGICARIVFYCAIANINLSIVDSTGGSSASMGKLSDLLKWNLAYLPSSSADAALELRVEHNRNEVIQEKYQGNRNPFVDHPEYACKIWGSTNSATKAACGL